jgi:CBS domain-containing protein
MALQRLSAPVGSLVKRAPVGVPGHTSVQAAAQLMRRENVSSVLWMEGGQLRGIVTDRDLRNRVLAEGLSPQRPIAEVATQSPRVVAAAHPAFDAMLAMTRHGIHHVPVLEGERVLGVITPSDLSAQNAGSPLTLAGLVQRASGIDDLQQAVEGVPLLVQQLVAADATALSTGYIVTAITDAVTRRLIALAEAALGPAPVPYVWVAAGSQAREEQTAKTDQDNCLVIDDAFAETAHGAWFEAFTRFVCDGLNACGYVHCPGGMMAMNPQWRLPRRRWAALFEQWTRQPEPMALMLTSVFFDLRAVQGEHALLDGLRGEVLQRTRGNTLFLAHLAGNALGHQPPLGWLGRLSTERRGEHKGRIDLKHGGVVPVVDLARIYALETGSGPVNTHERLRAAAERGALSTQSAHDLRDALEFIAMVRLRHQARRMGRGLAPDHFLDPAELSNFERTQLRDAFAVVRTLQQVLAQRYPRR